METPESAFSEIVVKLRTLLPRRAVPSNISKDFWMPDDSCRMCYECDSQFTVFKRRHHCRICGRVFCRKCTQNTICASADEREDEECIRVCNFCFNLRGQEMAASCNETPYLTPQISPSPSVTSFASCASSFNSRIGISSVPHSAVSYQHFSSGYGVERQNSISCVRSDDNFVSPVAGVPSTSLLFNNRSDEDDDDDEYVKDPGDLERRPFMQSQECFNNESVANLDSAYALDNVHSRNLRSQTSMSQAGEINFLRKTENSEISGDGKSLSFQSDVPLEGRLSRSGEESDDTENIDECNDESSIFPGSSPKSEQPNPDMEQPSDFESTDLIWIPPEPEHEDDEKESSMLDDDDDEGGLPCSSDSFSGKEFRSKDRSSEENRKSMKVVVDGHFRALVSQLLMGENVPVGEENDSESWLEIVTSLSWQAAMLVKPDASEGRGMDPGGYVKVKCIACGRRSESRVIKGVVCKKNVAHKHMTTRYKNPRLLLLGGALEYQRVSNQLSSLDTLIQQEMDYLKMAVSRIEVHHPNVLLVEKTVSRHAQEYLLAKEISLVLDMKRPRLERIARCTGAQIVSSLDNLVAQKVRHCELFHVEKFVEEHGSAGEAGKKLTKTLMFFEGCPKPLGCTVLLKGANGDELKKVKRVVQYAVFAAYHLALETSFLADERATLPETPFKSPVNTPLPDKQKSSERSISTITGLTFPIQGHVHTGEPQLQNACYNTMSDSPLLSSSSLNCNGGESKPSGPLSDAPSTTTSGGTSPAQAPASEGVQQMGTYSVSDRFSPSSASSGFLISELSASLKKALGEALPLISSGSYGAITSYLGLKERESKVSPIDDVPTISVVSESLHCGMASEEAPSELQMESLAITDNQVESGSFQCQPIVEQKNQDATQREDQGFSREAFPPSLDQQSILVSLSSRCVWKGTVCERGHLSRIKYYGSFDKSLGRFLQDKLFDQNFHCHSCDQPPEAHDHCYTHQQGRLTISVRKLSQELVLPGEREGKIWMWHRCLKCARKMGIPPATRRVVMSDAAWGLSFGKFLELSFSNHAAASRVASCGHSLHRDCLRFYGFGIMVACFRYSSINVYSVHLPPPKLNFSDPNQQEWLRKEAAEVAEKGELLFAEVSDFIHRARERVASTGCCPGVNALELRRLVELEGMLDKERAEFVESLEKAITKDWQPGQSVADILELNRLRRQIIFESYVWDHRLHYLHLSFKIRSSGGSDGLPEDLNVSVLNENNNSEKFVWSKGADKHGSDCDTANIPGVESSGSMMDRNSLDSSGILQFEEVPDGTKHTTTDTYVQSPSIPGSLQDSFLIDCLTEAFRVDERSDEGVKATELEENTGPMLLGQVQMNGNKHVGEINTVGLDVIYQAVSVENGKGCTNKQLPGTRAGIVGSGDIRDALEEDLGDCRTLSEPHSCILDDLSVTLDAAWIGEGNSIPVQTSHVTSEGHEAICAALTIEKSGGCAESALKMVSDTVQLDPVPSMVKIGSVDSSCNMQDKDGSELPFASMPTPVKSFDSLEDFESWIWLPFSHLYMVCGKGSQGSSASCPPKFDSVSGYTPVYLSSTSKLVSQGCAGLLLPSGVNDTVIAVFEDEPTSLIAYALASEQYRAQVSDKVTEEERYREKDSDAERETEDSSGMYTGVCHPLQQLDGSRELAEIPSEGRSTSSEEVSTSGSSGTGAADLLLCTNVMHAEVSFGDESPPGKGKYSIICYYAKRFDALRKICCPTEMEFIRSLSRCKKWGAQGGKSKVFFAKTLDDRFIIKQVTKTELESFFKFAPEYFKHLSYSLSTGSPTCLAKILGIYQVTIKHAKGGKDLKMDLMVMENLLFGRNPTRLYDLKGSLRSRYNSDSTGTNKVLLDQNFVEAMQTSPVFVGNKAKHLLERAVWNDTSFLTSINVMDYSLLVGVDEDRGELVLGIIDFMRQYTWDKHLETWVKASGILGGPKNESPTVISPKQYKKRFRKAMSTYFPTVPDPWSPSTIPSPQQILDAGENGSPSAEDAGEQVTKSEA